METDQKYCWLILNYADFVQSNARIGITLKMDCNVPGFTDKV